MVGRRLAFLSLCLLLSAEVCSQDVAGDEPAYDVIIRGGRILDGTGNPWFRGDVAVRDGRIAAVGILSGLEAGREIDAAGLVVVPGFIDIHSHADDSKYGPSGLRSQDARRRAAPSLVTQGITTVVVNQDGRMPEGGVLQQRAEHDALGIGPNAALLAGHNSIRHAVMGTDHRREATPAEIELMRGRVRQEMEDGAFGLSSGLEYVPGRWSTTQELLALVNIIAPYGGVYIAHQRSEAAAPMWWRPSQVPEDVPTIFDALSETIFLGEQTGAVVVASHLKTRGTSFWGTSAAVIEEIERARSRGVAIYADQYPYTTSGTDGNVVLIPPWAREDQDDLKQALRSVLDDSVRNATLRRDVEHTLQYRGGAEQIVVFEYPDTMVIGKNLAELARKRGIDPVDMAIRLQLEGFGGRPGGARLRGFSMAEHDVAAIAARPWVATSSDGGIAVEGDTTSVHTRFYGTFPRKIRRYALDRQVMAVADAVRSATSLPAQILGLQHRGLIRESFVADIAILNLKTLGEVATFQDPHHYATGVEYVLVSGDFVVDQGEPTWALPGRSLVRSNPTQ